MIKNMNIKNREEALEQYRQEHCPFFPSRLHSVYLTDEKNLAFWSQQLKKGHELSLFKVSVTGDLFKSSDLLLPAEELTVAQMYEAAKNYWYPDNRKEKNMEYLFQGELKVLQKLK